MSLSYLREIAAYPPFFNNLIVQIEESKLLSNYANVYRLQLELFNCFIRYQATLKLSLLIQYDTERLSPLWKSLYKLKTPNSDDWFEYAIADLDNFDVFDSAQKIHSHLQLMQASWHSVGGYEKLLDDLQLASSGSLKCFHKIRNVKELIQGLKNYVSQNSDHDLRSSIPKIRKNTKILDAALCILFGEFKELLRYKLCSVQSFVKKFKETNYFFRLHLGNNVAPFKQAHSNELRIGSVYLAEYTELEATSQTEIILNLSPFIISPIAELSDASFSRLAFYNKFIGGSVEYLSIPDYALIDNQTFIEDFSFLNTNPSDLQSINERMYYRKLLDYYRDGIVDQKEEQALEIMQKVYNLPIGRLRFIESRVKNELGIFDSGDYQESLRGYEKLFSDLASLMEVGAIEKLSLQEYAKEYNLRSTDVWEIELNFWIKKAEELSAADDEVNLRKALIQISLVDFQNPIIEKFHKITGVSIADDELIIERKKAFEEYLNYIQIVYSNQKMSPDERRFLEIQRKRLRISEKEAYELEFLEKNLLGLLHKEHDDFYEMQCENFKLGGILLSRGMIDEEQLKLGLDIQSRDAGAKLGAVLYDLGFVKHDELSQILKLQQHLIFRRKSYFLGTMAMKFAFIDRRQLKECLKIQEHEFQVSQSNKKLGDIMLENGYISQPALSFLLSIQSLSRQN